MVALEHHPSQFSFAAALLALGVSLAEGRSAGVALARTVPVLIPLSCCVGWGEGAGILTRKGLRTLYAAGLILVLVVTAVGMVQDKREREAYSRLVDQARTLVGLGDAAGAESLLKQAR
jgi:hypothetical protein